MMLQFVVLSVCLTVSCAKFKNSREAAILSESRYLNTAGQFGSTYIQEDGVQFSEEADSEGNRKGSYTYIDPNGQTKRITYTAGKDGFKAMGDHLPIAPSVPVSPFPVPGLSPFYRIQPIEASNSLQMQLQSLPGNSLYNFFQFQPANPSTAAVLLSSTEASERVPSAGRHYPPAKLNVKHSSDGFSYTFDSIV